MTFLNLKRAILMPVFSATQVQRLFNEDDAYKINISLSRMVKRGDLVRIKRGLFRFPEMEVDELTLATLMYKPSYVSLESALQIYGLIPEEVMAITSVTPITTKNLKTANNRFLYTKIQRALFWGYDKIVDSHSDNLFYNLAKPEKAILDYIYIRQINDLGSARVDLESLDRNILKEYLQFFPSWVQNVMKDNL